MTDFLEKRLTVSKIGKKIKNNQGSQRILHLRSELKNIKNFQIIE